VESSTDRLGLAPDDYSDMRMVGLGPKTKERPRWIPRCVNTRERGRADTQPLRRCRLMAKSTRGSSPDDSRTPLSGVNITPPTQRGPVTTTHTVA
jgi:hypothetical protein